MRKDYYSNSKDYINRWVVSYADFVTMLLALFMVMYAVSQNDTKQLSAVLKKTFGVEKIQTSQSTEKENVSNLELAQPIDTTSQLYEKFKEKFAKNTSLSVVKEKRGIIIRINDTMLFDEGSAIIKPEAKVTLNQVTTELKAIENPIIIEGHTDSTPIKNQQYPSNWELSTARATNIIKYLIENNLISPKRLSAVGYGEYMPISENTSSEGRAKNRRVDIIVLSSK